MNLSSLSASERSGRRARELPRGHGRAAGVRSTRSSSASPADPRGRQARATSAAASSGTAAATKRTKRSGSPGVPLGGKGAGAGAEAQRAGKPVSKSRRAASSGSEAGDARHSRGRSALSASSDETPRRGIGPRGAKKDPPPPPSSGTKMSPIEFIQEKTQLVKTASAMLAEASSSKSVATRIDGVSGKLSKDDLGKLEQSPTVCKEKLATAREQLTRAVSNLDKVRLDGWLAAQTEVHQAMAALTEVTDDAEENLKVMMFLLGQMTKGEKAKKNADRYRRVKFINRLTSGGYSKPMAKFMADRIEESRENVAEGQGKVAINPKTFDESSPVVFKGSSGATEGPQLEDRSEFLESLLVYLKGMKSVDEKEAALVAALRDHPEWKGAMSKLDVDGLRSSSIVMFSKADTELDSLPGACPWIVLQRPFSWRLGPSAWPLVGLGALMFPMAEEVDYFYFMAPIAQILEQGIVLSHLDKFFESDAGAEFMRQHMVFIKAEPGSAIWCPFGWLCIPLVVDRWDMPASERCGLSLVINPAMVEWASAVPELTLRAIFQLNSDHCNKVMTKKAWQTRCAFLEEFMKKTTVKSTGHREVSGDSMRCAGALVSHTQVASMIMSMILRTETM